LTRPTDARRGVRVEYRVVASDVKRNGCEGTIQHALRHADGVERVSANYIEGTVQVEGDGGVDVDALVAQIDALGFAASA
jgi:copper chaperone CopZ